MADATQPVSVASRVSQWSAHHGLTRHQRDAMAAAGMKKADIDKAEVSDTLSALRHEVMF